jgi:hypothetical protein
MITLKLKNANQSIDLLAVDTYHASLITLSSSSRHFRSRSFSIMCFGALYDAWEIPQRLLQAYVDGGIG